MADTSLSSRRRVASYNMTDEWTIRNRARSHAPVRLFAFPPRQGFVIRGAPMPEVKGHASRKLDREEEKGTHATKRHRPLLSDVSIFGLGELLEGIVAKALELAEETSDLSVSSDVVIQLLKAAQESTRHWRENVESGSARASMPGESAAQIESAWRSIESAWRSAMIEAQGWVSSSADEEKEATEVPIEESTQEASERDLAIEPQPERLPSPFILDEWVFGPGDIPRSGGRKVSCRFLHDETRWPDRLPGE
jgi:hypothetical protein